MNYYSVTQEGLDVVYIIFDDSFFLTGQTKNNISERPFEPFLYASSVVAVSLGIMSSRGFRGGRRLLYLIFSSHDSEQARGGRGGYQQRDMGPPDQVLGIFAESCL